MRVIRVLEAKILVGGTIAVAAAGWWFGRVAGLEFWAVAVGLVLLLSPLVDWLTDRPMRIVWCLLAIILALLIIPPLNPSAYGMLAAVLVFWLCVLHVPQRLGQQRPGGPDSPITSRDGDLLGRGRLVGEVVRLIEGTHADESVRIALYGDWGSGKTSVMHLIKEECESKNYPCVWFNPWMYQTDELALESFMDELDRKIIGLGGGVTVRVFSLIGSLVGIAESKYHLLTFPLGWLMKSLGLNNAREYTGQLLERVLNKNSKGSRLVVFLDDLDRTPERILSFLKVLLNTIDLPRCIFIVGITRAALECALREQITDSMERVRYMEKMFDYELEVPTTHTEYYSEFVRESARQFSDCKVIVYADLMQVAEVLPRNPRRLKKFLRRLYADAPHLERFLEDPIYWPQLYVARLIVTEFPVVWKDVLRDTDIRDKLGVGDCGDDERRKELTASLDRIAIEHNLAQADQERFRELFFSFYTRGPFQSTIGSMSTEDYFQTADDPTQMTQSEFRTLFGIYTNDPKEGMAELRRRARFAPEPALFLRMAANYCLQQCEESIRQAGQKQSSSAVMALEWLTAICGEEKVLFPELAADIVKLISSLPAYTQQYLGSTAHQLWNTCLSVAEQTPEDYLDHFQPWDEDELPEDVAESEEFKHFIDRLCAALGKLSVDQMRTSQFTWRGRLSNAHYYVLFVRHDSPFLKENVIDRLRDISPQDAYELFLTLAHFVETPRWEFNIIPQILQNTDFMSFVWELTCKELAGKSPGDQDHVYNKRDELRAKIEDPNFLPDPEWR